MRDREQSRSDWLDMIRLEVGKRRLCVSRIRRARGNGELCFGALPKILLCFCADGARISYFETGE